MSIWTFRFEALTIFQNACKECNIPKYRIHDLRRTFASKYATKLTPIELQKLVRHADINTTLKHYINIDLQDIAKKI
ncbi:MAG: tyrosine-type recombinase/integrase [Bacteroidetes bacterium]|nr:tyrosine-type recombinase/integrase [Bacteroidota bacterium]